MHSTLHSTLNNIIHIAPPLQSGTYCGKHLKYPELSGTRKAEGGLRLNGKYKQNQPTLPLISVITVVYNDADSIAKTIESVLAQTYTNVEYIIVDGGSTDGTIEVIQQYQDSIDYFVSEPDTGIYDAMNKGLSLAQGAYIGLLNSADWYEPNALEVIAENALEAPGCIIAARQRTLDENFREINTRGLRFSDERAFLRMPVSHPGTFVPFEVYEAIGNYRGDRFSIIADWDFFIRCVEKNILFHSVNSVVVNYWRVGISAMGDSAVYDEQVRLLQSRFPTLSHYSLLFMLSSRMDENTGRDIRGTIQQYLNKGVIIPEKIMSAVYLYRFKNQYPSYEHWLESFGKACSARNGEFGMLEERDELQMLIEQGNQLRLREQEIWLLGDRGWDAQDNAFVFYCWLKEHHPEINAWFVITQESPDFEKVHQIDPETVVEYNSTEHKLYYLFSRHVISSQGGDHCHPLNYDLLKTSYTDVFTSQYTFLQHGVLKDYISYFHKGQFYNCLYAITGDMEKNLFEHNYQYTSYDLLLSELCRYDILHDHKPDNSEEHKPFILFMPTWRSWIKDEEGFLNSEYFKMLDKLLQSPRLIEMIDGSGYIFKFLIHPNFAKYAHLLTTGSDTIEILSSDTDIGKMIRECSVMITDYSSSIMDAGYMGKPVIYFQPDYEKFRSGHYLETAAFSYTDNGLGPVTTDTDVLLDNLSHILEAGAQSDDIYIKRSDYIFKYRDGRARQRTFDGINRFGDETAHIAQFYESEELIPMGPLSIFIKKGILHLFHSPEEKDGILADEFSIRYTQYGGKKKTQKVNLVRSSLYLNTKRGGVYAFYTLLPELTTEVECLGNTYTIPPNALRENTKPKKTLTVAQLGFTIRGGAGIASVRLHNGLNQTGVESYVFQKENPRIAPYHIHTFENDASATLNEWTNATNTYKGNTFFSMSIPNEHESLDFLFNFDVVNLHWTAKCLSAENIAYLSHGDKPVVWTIHDINAISGGCHYFHGCTQWKTDCMDCPQLKDHFDNYPAQLLAAKKKYFNTKNMTIVVLNRHFKRLVEQSPIFKDSRIEIIPNSIDTEKFRPLDVNVFYRRLKLEREKRYILYVAAYASTIKGYSEFEETIRLLSQKECAENTEILLAGDLPPNRNIELPYVDLGKVSEQVLIELYNIAELTVVSSIEDNHPNVILESISCGTPVVGFKVGGLPDIVTDGETGYSVEIGDCAALADRIEKVLTGPDMSENCRNYAEKNLKLSVQAERYKKLYQELCQKPRFTSPIRKKIPYVFPETAVSWAKMNEQALLWNFKRNASKANVDLTAFSSRVGVPVPTRFNNACFKAGWSFGEQWGRWTSSGTAVLKLKLQDFREGPLTATFSIKYSRVKQVRQNVNVHVNGGLTPFAYNGTRLIFPVTPTSEKEVEIKFHIKGVLSPYELGTTGDKRQLGLGIDWFKIDSEQFVSAGERVRKELEYRVGRSIVRSFKSIVGILFLPWIIWMQVALYRQDRNSNDWHRIPQIKDYSDANEIRRHARHLSYRLGRLSVDAWRHKWKLTILPFQMVRELFK
ncbi:MAG: CDP-glycerol glycerophosphotransferase family protein [Deltaproteobacteria bacterium]|nr:CDP-glycerol glycerophosphotransferase family protein [Deltaproteobacteria bacterium]